MAKFAELTGTLVTNVIICDSKEIAKEITGSICIELEEISQVGIGWQYKDDNFIAPTVEFLD